MLRTYICCMMKHVLFGFGFCYG